MRILRRIVLIAGLLAGLTVSAGDGLPSARIAIIIDDLGNSLPLGDQALALPGALTFSVLPQRPYSRRIAEAAHASGREVMLHLPMQAGDGRALGPAGLRCDMDRAEFARTLDESLDAVPHVAGVNNHMGSLLTRQPWAMRWLMQDLARRPALYFIDSRTDVRTVAREHAHAAGLANAARDVFLDNQADTRAIRAQLERLVAIARRRGSAIGIGHPYPETLAVLAEELPRLADIGIQLVPASRLVRSERKEGPWHASSSPLPTVAKN